MSTKPITPKVKPQNIPEELKTLERWVVWKWELRKGKWAKPPKQVNDRYAATNDPTTWTTFENAIGAHESGKFDGIGLVLPDGITGIDLDDCLEGGQPNEYASMILAKCKTYCEVSPSGTGLKFLGAGRANDKLTKTESGKIEIYDGENTSRYFTVTGDRFDDNHQKIINQRDEIHAIQSMMSDAINDHRIGDSEIDVLEVVKMLEALKPERADEYETWLKVGMVLAWCDKSDDMLDRWIEWSEQSPKFDEDTCRSKWDSFKRENGKLVTLGSLRKLASEDGYVAPILDWRPEDFTELRTGEHPDRGEYVINGLVRVSEVCFVIASSKDGKSWLMGLLAWCFVTGFSFLGMTVRKGKVLYIDNELPRREIDYRLDAIAKELDHTPGENEITVFARRGKNSDIRQMVKVIRSMDLDGYTAIILDCLYKAIPEGSDENKSREMGEVMNILQTLSEDTGLPIFIVHHTTKGDQSQKKVMDLAAGSGAFGRSLDAMIGIRDHETEGLSVCEFKVRSGQPLPPISVRFKWPLWSLEHNELALVKMTRQSKQDTKETDKRYYTEILSRIDKAGGSIQRKDLAPHIGGAEKFNRIIARMIDENLVVKNESTIGKRPIVSFSRLSSDSDSDSVFSSELDQM